MAITFKQFQGTYQKRDLYWLILPMIVIGKIIRYTVLKSSLVNAGIGHRFLDKILAGNIHFTFFENVDDSANPSGNACFILQIFYKVFGIDTYGLYEVAISIVWNILLFIIFKHLDDFLNLFQLLFGAFSVMAMNIFDFCLAKEPVQMIIFILMYYVLVSRKLPISGKYVGALLVLLLSVMTMRRYYLLIIYFAVITVILFRFLWPKRRGKNKVFTMILFLAILSVCYFVLLEIAQFVDPDSYKELLRVRTREASATTQIHTWFYKRGGNLVVFDVEYFFTLLRMLFPVELLSKGFKFIPYTAYQLLYSFVILRGIWHHDDLNPTEKLALYLSIGFLFGSATFEPDFGSWIRHESVTCPMMYVVSGMAKNAEIKPEPKPRPMRRTITFTAKGE